MAEHNSKTKKKANNLWEIIAVLAFIILLTLSYKLTDPFKPSTISNVPLNDSCDLHKQACTSILPNGASVTFDIEPKTIPLLAPLKLNVHVNGLDVSAIEVDFLGIEIAMGYNRSQLEASNNKNEFVGKAILPVCILTKMNWDARVLLHTKNGLIMVPFRFYTIK